MFYAFPYTPVITNTENNPKVIELHLSAGVIHQVDVIFQSGCNHQEFVQIFHGNFQVWPSNRGGKLRGNATIISFRDFYELKLGQTVLQAKVWTTLTTDFKELIVQMGILSKRVLQPLSFEELIRAVKEI